MSDHPPARLPHLSVHRYRLCLQLKRGYQPVGIRVLIAGTDGTDGPTDAAGALVDGQTWDASGHLAIEQANIAPWLDAKNALIRTGPTNTNVMDLLIAEVCSG